MLHVTLENGETLLFHENQNVWVACWVSDNGKYVSGEIRGRADTVVVRGRYVIEHDEDGPILVSLSRVASIRSVPDLLPTTEK